MVTGVICACAIKEDCSCLLSDVVEKFAQRDNRGSTNYRLTTMTVIHSKEGGVLIKVGDHTVGVLEGEGIITRMYSTAFLLITAPP